MIVAISVGIGMITLIAPNFKQWMPHGVHPLIESGILLSPIVAVALNLFYNARARTQPPPLPRPTRLRRTDILIYYLFGSCSRLPRLRQSHF